MTNATHPVARRVRALPVLLALGALLMLMPSVARAAQDTDAPPLVPDRLYYGVDRPMPMTVSRPAGSDGSELSIALFGQENDEPIATASVTEGKVDLSALFPALWGDQGRSAVHYAQLVAGDDQVGSPVVLQPMVSPRSASVVPGTSGQIQFGPSANVYSGIRAYVERHVVFETDRGDMRFRMRPDEAPNTAWNFLRLADGGYYTDVVFHRIVPTLPSGESFVIQVGDPTATGAGGPGYMIDLEPSELPHDFGVLSMARSSNPDTNGSQVFVCLSRAGTSFLDGRYCAFAEAVSGADTIRTIAEAPVGGDSGQSPLDPKPVVRRAYLVPAPPVADRTAPISARGDDSDESADDSDG